MLDRGDTNRIMGIDTYTTAVIIASAIFFYRAAKYDDTSAFLWAVLSVVVTHLWCYVHEFNKGADI